MATFKLGRREFLRLGLVSGLAGLTGCARGDASPELSATAETLPKELVRALPRPWHFRKIEINQGSDSLIKELKQGSDLLALGDGWLKTLPHELLQPVSASGTLEQRLDIKAKDFINSLGPELSEKVFPIGVSPWVMVFRNGGPWLTRARSAWDVLLEPGLKGEVILPKSPRIVISLANRMKSPHALRDLRNQALAFDDQNGLNWLLNGQARVAVLPLQRCLRSIIRDQRFSAVLPVRGAPLNWTLLVRPASTNEPLPHSWLEEAWQMPALGLLLAGGWIPPLRQSELEKAAKFIPASYQSILLPSEELWSNCWSLPPLNSSDRKELLSLWVESIP